MKKSYTFLLLTALSASTWAQLSDPIPETIGFGDVIIELEDWLTLPRSSGGGGGRARLSVMRWLNDGRLFVNDQRGLIYEVEKGSSSLYFAVRDALPNFIDAPGLGTGLHSFAFHPDFLANGKLYTVHSEPGTSGTPDLKGPTAPITSAGQISVVSEWTATDPGATTFAGTRRELFSVYFPGTIHCAQEIAFNPNAGPGDPDYGKLYVCLGEGSSYLKGLWTNEHRLDSPMGTILRIDPLGDNSPNGSYGIPSDNPWADSTDPSVLKEIYAYGFRNPHRINWDTGGTGRFYVGDIGETQVEELNLLGPGRDYGFPQREGTFRLDPTRPGDNTSVYPLPADDALNGYTYPVAQFDHDEGIAIVSGPVYRGSLAPELVGRVLFGGIAWGRIFTVQESTLAYGSQALIQEARLELDGVEGSLTSFVGNSRADLRWGMDGDGEVYVMTKTDGKIRKIVGARLAGGQFMNEPERWQKVMDLDETDPAYLVTNAVPGGFAAVRPDPYGDGENRVLALGATGERVRITLPATPVDEIGSVYFRFALAEESSGARVLAGPDASTFASIVGSLDGGGALTINDRNVTLTASSGLRPRVWYEAWLVFPDRDDRFSLYVRGDDWTAPSLLRSGLAVNRAVNDGLVALTFQVLSEGAEAAALFLDDVYVDPTAPNISAPRERGWMLVSNFEALDPVADWNFAAVTSGAVNSAFSGRAEVAIEASGNQVLELAASLLADTALHAVAPLPTRVEVSDIVTLYGRVMVNDFATHQAWGLANVSVTQLWSMGESALEVMARWSDSGSPNGLFLQDDANEVTVPGVYEPAVWYEFWMVVRNGGEASGGQTYDLYMRLDGNGDAPTLVYENAGFRAARETPMDFFEVIASDGALGKDGIVAYDDLFLTRGAVVEAPAGTGYGLYPGARGWKVLPWFGDLDDTHFPWVYHLEHGWLYVQANLPKGSWHYDLERDDWLWVTPATYPFLYSGAAQEWLYYLPGSASPRWFYGFGRQAWFSVPSE